MVRAGDGIYIRVPASSHRYSKWCGSKAGHRCKVRQEKCRSHDWEHTEPCGGAKGSTLSQPQHFKDEEPNRDKQLITLAMRSTCIVHKQLLEGLFKPSIALVAFHSPGWFPHPQHPQTLEGLCLERGFSHQWRLFPSLPAISPGLTFLHIPYTLLPHQRPDPVER